MTFEGILMLSAVSKILVLNHNKPEFYCAPPELFGSHWQKVLEDLQLAQTVRNRAHSNLDEL